MEFVLIEQSAVTPGIQNTSMRVRARTPQEAVAQVTGLPLGSLRASPFGDHATLVGRWEGDVCVVVVALG